MKMKDKLHIAKEAYKAMRQCINAVESYNDARVNCMWPGYISVDGTVFAPEDMRDEENLNE